MRLSIALLLLCGVTFAQEKTDITTKIEHVTVYQDRALVTRTADVKLKAGKNTLSIKRLATKVDTKSLRAAITGEGAELLGVSWEREVTRVIQNARLSKLEKRKEKLIDQQNSLNDEIRSKQILLNYVQRYRAHTKMVIAEESTKEEVEAAKWEAAVNYLDKQGKDLKAEMHELNTRVQELGQEVNVVNQDLQRYSSLDARASITAYVSVRAAKATTCTVALSYVTYGAGWTPRYDARINPSSKTIKLDYLGSVKQSSGESWDNVALSLSTAKPHINATPKRLKPLWISGYKTERGRRIAIGGRVMAEARDMAPPAPATVESPASASSSVKNEGHAVSFAIKEKAMIPSDGRPYQVSVHGMTLKARLSYETIPKVKPFVYLKAETSNASKYPLLEGPVSIFRSAGYIGTSRLKFTAPASPISLFAGINEAVQVKRNLSKLLEKDGSLFSSKSKVTAWDFVLRNGEKKPVTVTLKENVPVSQMDEIRIQILEETSYGYDFDKKNGILSWKVELKPGEVKELRMAYKVIDKLD